MVGEPGVHPGEDHGVDSPTGGKLPFKEQVKAYAKVSVLQTDW